MKLLVNVIFLVAYLWSPINANDGIPEGRVIYGNDVTDSTIYPWHARVKSAGRLCGGSLITDKFVLTAAHCSDNCIVGTEYKVLLGGIKRKKGKQYLGRLKACHNLYEKINHIHYYDIAMVELTESVAMRRGIGTISIFTEPVMIPDDSPVTAIGFGRTEDIKYPPILQQATDLTIYNQHKCEKVFRDSYGSFHAHICTKSKVVKDQSPCIGDSGGSLVYENDENESVLLGITSFVTTTADGKCTGVAVYTRLNHPEVASWIQEMLN